MRLHSSKTIINYIPEGNPPKNERTRINIALYLYIAGLVLLSLYILYIIYTKIRYVEFTGFIQVPKVVVKTYKDGVVDKIFVKSGLMVKKGEPLFSIKYSVETKLPISVKLNLQSQLDNLRVKLNAIEASLKHINTPDILRINGQIRSVKAQIIFKEGLLKSMQKMVSEKSEFKRTSTLLELSTVNPDSLDTMRLNIERLKATIFTLKSTLKSLEEERRNLEKIKRNDLLLKERTLRKNISLLEEELGKINSAVFKIEAEDIIKSQLNGRILGIDVFPHQSVMSGDSLAVVIPYAVKIKFFLVTGQKKLKYLKKGVGLNLILPDSRELHGRLVDINSAALKYQPKLKREYWPLASPVIGEIEVKNPPKDLVGLDGVKIKAVIERKIWSIF